MNLVSDWQGMTSYHCSIVTFREDVMDSEFESYRILTSSEIPNPTDT